MLHTASRSSETLTLDCWKTQLELAVAWNRVDIAKTEIFTEDSLWSVSLTINFCHI